MLNTPGLSLIIPVHNEATGLLMFWKSLLGALDGIAETYEIIFVDDGSRDETWTLIQDIASRSAQVKGVRFTRNFGKEAAIHAGLVKAKGQSVVIMDGDGQHPAELLPEMLRCWREERALIVAARKNSRASDSLIQRLRSRAFNTVMKALTNLDMEGSTDYRLLDRRVVNALLDCPEKIRFFRGMTVWLGFSVREIMFDVPPRLLGSGQWNTLALMKLASHAILAYSSKPLYYVFATGLAGILVSILLGVQAIYSWAMGIAVNGWTSLTILILFFGSLNLAAVGVVGLYLSQLFAETKRRPAYFVIEEIDG